MLLTFKQRVIENNNKVYKKKGNKRFNFNLKNFISEFETKLIALFIQQS